MFLDNRGLKHKLRELKKIEISIRTEHFLPTEEKFLVWNKFFSTKNDEDNSVKYPLYILSVFGPNARKQVIEEFFYQMYFEIFEYSNVGFEKLHDPELLSELGLGSEASREDIKKKFRELAKKYHPDHGGSNEKMVKLLEIYEKLLKKS